MAPSGDVHVLLAGPPPHGAANLSRAQGTDRREHVPAHTRWRHRLPAARCQTAHRFDEEEQEPWCSLWPYPSHWFR